MTIAYTDEIVRILVQVGAKRTTVSLDGVLAKVLIKKLGGYDEMVEWIRAQAQVIQNSSGYAENKSTIGLSRLIQQRSVLKVSGEI